MNDIVLLAVGGIGLIAIFVVSYYFLFKGDNAYIKEEKEKSKPVPKTSTRKTKGKGKKSRGLDAMKQRQAQGETSNTVSQEETESGDEESSAFTKKQMKKAEKLRERQEEREALEAAREAQLKRKDEKNEKYRKKEEEREKARLEKEEEEKKKALEAEKKAQEEYEQWKDLFTVETEGSNEQDVGSESQGQLQEFINYIVNKKVVMLEELAAEFDLRTQEAINRLQGLEKMGRITGVFDDRGKFIYISEEEMDKVAKFIEKRGRISISALAVESNKLIDLTSSKYEPTTDTIAEPGQTLTEEEAKIELVR